MLLPAEHRGEPADGTANDQVGDDCQNGGNNQQFAQEHSAVDDELVHGIDYSSENEYPAYIVRGLPQKLMAAGWIRDGGPESDRTPCPRVPQPRADCKYAGYQRLKHQPEVHWPVYPAEQVSPEAVQYVVHAPPKISGDVKSISRMRSGERRSKKFKGLHRVQGHLARKSTLSPGCAAYFNGMRAGHRDGSDALREACSRGSVPLAFQYRVIRPERQRSLEARWLDCPRACSLRIR